MKHYCICLKETFIKYSYLFHHHEGAHYIDLDAAGREILVAVSFNNEGAEHAWYSLPGVEALPHPYFQGNQPLKPHHVEKLRAYRLQEIDHGHTVFHVAHYAAKHHPLMRLNRHLHPETVPPHPKHLDTNGQSATPDASRNPSADKRPDIGNEIRDGRAGATDGNDGGEPKASVG